MIQIEGGQFLQMKWVWENQVCLCMEIYFAYVCVCKSYLQCFFLAQALSVIVNLFNLPSVQENLKPVLIVAGNVGLVRQWAGEAEKFTTGISVLAIESSKVLFLSEFFCRFCYITG